MPVPSDSRYSFRRVPSKWSCHDVNTGSDFQPQELHSSQPREALFVLVVVDGLVDSVGLTVGASVRLAVLLTPDELGKCGDQVAGGFKDQVRIDGSGIAVVLEPYGEVPCLVDECFEIGPEPARVSQLISEDVGPTLEVGRLRRDS